MSQSQNDLSLSPSACGSKQQVQNEAAAKKVCSN
jgi:hypothetical protein